MPSEATHTVQLLDCTLRDGGYYNDWDFSTEIVEQYLKSTSMAGIRLIELGFRQLPGDRYLGPLAYTTDEFINQLTVPESTVLGVMCDAKRLISGDSPGDVVRQLFVDAKDSRVDLVRIAANYPELQHLGPEIELLSSMGYRIGVNLMQISDRSPEELAEFGRLATEWGAEVAYFADSFGGIRSTEIPQIISAMRATWSGPIGCHMHDNMTMGLANSLAAVDEGATWVDGTIRGMGRGPGNARSEYLAIELTRRGLAQHDHLPLLDLVTGSFQELQEHYGWGSNIYYFLSAAFGVHPTYIVELTRDGRYGVPEIIGALEELRDAGGNSFSRGRLDSAASPLRLTEAEGKYDASGWCAGRDVLIVAPGPAGRERRRDIEAFVRQTSPLVLALNVQPPIDAELVDAYVACHPIRALIDAERIAQLDAPIFIPAQVSERLTDLGEGVDVRDYGMAVSPEEFAISATGCRVPRSEAAAYALAVAAAGGARSILLSGFDGFDAADERQLIMTDVLNRFTELENVPPVIAVTRTSYPIQQSSIFAPRIAGAR